MPFNGAGVFTRVYQWVNDAANGIYVDATRTDTDSNDIASGLTNCVTRDGQSPPTANLPMGSKKFTGLASGSASTDSVNYGQVFNSPTFTTPYAATMPTLGSNSLLLATTSYVDQTAFSTALPAQSLGFLISNGVTASFGNTFTGFATDEVKGADIASAATINLTTATGNLVHVTGTTTITAITIPSGAERTVVFDGVLTLTHNATTLILPGGTNITTAAGDSMKVRGDGSGNARVVTYTKASGTSVVTPTPTAAQGASEVLLSTVTVSAQASADVDTTFDSTYDVYRIEAKSIISASGATRLACRLKIGGSYLTTSVYSYKNQISGSGDSTFSGNNADTNASTYIVLGSTVGTTDRSNFYLKVTDPTLTTADRTIYWNGSQSSASQPNMMQGIGCVSSTGALTGVRFFFESGNITSGVFYLYGLKKS